VLCGYLNINIEVCHCPLAVARFALCRYLGYRHNAGSHCGLTLCANHIENTGVSSMGRVWEPSHTTMGTRWESSQRKRRGTVGGGRKVRIGIQVHANRVGISFPVIPPWRNAQGGERMKRPVGQDRISVLGRTQRGIQSPVNDPVQTFWIGSRP
jgi:hypothetical protein